MKKSTSIILLALLAFGVIIGLKQKPEPVKPNLSSPQPTINYSGVIQNHASQANRRNLNALQLFEMDLNRVLKEHEPKLGRAACAAAQEAADYKSCCKIIYYLAWDKVKKQNQSEIYLNREIKPILDPSLKSLGHGVDAAAQKLDYDLRRSTLQLAVDLAALGRTNRCTFLDVDLDKLSRADFQQSLRNLGYNAVGIGVAIIFDGVAICNSRIGPFVWKKIAGVAANMFTKQVTKVAASATIAAADGPSPLGDIAAIVGLICTGYDIYASQKQFEKDLNTSLDNLISEAKQSVHSQALDHARAIVERYQKLQDSIGSQTLEQITMRN